MITRNELREIIELSGLSDIGFSEALGRSQKYIAVLMSKNYSNQYGTKVAALVCTHFPSECKKVLPKDRLDAIKYYKPSPKPKTGSREKKRRVGAPKLKDIRERVKGRIFPNAADRKRYRQGLVTLDDKLMNKLIRELKKELKK